MKATLTLLLLALALAAPAVADPPGWKPYASTPGRFTVLLPATPTLTSSRVSTPAGQVEKNIFSVRSGELSLSLNYSDLPTLALMFGGANRIFDHAQGEFLKDIGGLLLSSAKQQWQGHAGRETTFEIPAADARGRFRMMLVGGRLYCMGAWHPDGASVPGDWIESFFASFRTTP
ncbi:MAG: hypothetical protein FJX76_23330 [Armatimonadetes bacterium]|nr:hypothetical protein [Armatimonadota bacterium]